jgi:hypothetical protein
MINLVFVILDGTYKNLSLASIRFEKFGSLTKYPIIECTSWVEGFLKAQDYSHIVFLSSGTVFTDIEKFINMLNNYPHQGLIGHITDNGNFSLHPQCFLLETKLFTVDDFNVADYDVSVIRSDKNIHHDYTPLWLRPGTEIKHYNGRDFGERLIAAQLSRGYIVVNWNNSIRQFKQYLYTSEQADAYIQSQQDYFDLAENQLWVLNNETIEAAPKHKHLVCPASGLFWMLNLINTKIESIDLVDISRPQLQLAKELLDKWDGVDYGTFVYDFIKRNQIVHYNLENPNLSKQERVLLLKRSVFVNRVNTIFAQHMPEDFSIRWQKDKTKQIKFYNQDIIDFLKTASGEFDIWLSNILNYKYTMLKHSITELQLYEHYTKSK